MIIRELDDNSFPRLKQYLELEPASNIYALSNLLSNTEGSRFFNATSHDEGKIDGPLAIRLGFKRPFIWLVTDTIESTIVLSKKVLNFQNASLWVKPENEDILETEVNKMSCKINRKRPYDIMELDRSNVKLDIKHEWIRLSKNDAHAWAKTEALAEKEEVGDKKAGRENLEPSQEQIKSSERLLGTLSCFGIFGSDQQSLIARSALEELSGTTAIRRVFTDPAFRNLGYGRSITSVAVQEALKNKDHPRIILFVLQNNGAAKRVYETLGFHRVGSRTELELGAFDLKHRD